MITEKVGYCRYATNSVTNSANAPVETMFLNNWAHPRKPEPLVHAILAIGPRTVIMNPYREYR